ncbi:MAG: hypothetical protein FJ249_00115 [Nitrospira sp.]|nr:hypothetical protein [Nitrospira sp.]
MLLLALVAGLLLMGFTPAPAEDRALESLLRAQAFNKEFEGFDHYQVAIEADQPQPDGSREVTAVASGRFLGQVQRLKALFLVVGDKVVGGQILEKDGLPPCTSSPRDSKKSL